MQPKRRASCGLRLMQQGVPLCALVATLAQAAGPTGALNDTGQTRCLNTAGTALEACSTANTGNNSVRPGQDGRFGRDPAAANAGASGFSKPAGSGGSGGFAFTPLDVSGNPIALTGTPLVPSATPRCIWDHVTNLIWEVKTDDGGLQDKDWTYRWGSYNGGTSCLGNTNCNTTNYIVALNGASVCPVNGAGSWRLPSRRELFSIVDHNNSSMAIDTNYFPHTKGYYYWSADVYTFTSNTGWPGAWSVVFSNGKTSADRVYYWNYYYGYWAFNEFSIRLVRSGQ